MAGTDTTEGMKDVNALLDGARVPTTVKIAAGTLATAGGLTALVGVQNLTLIRWIGWMWLVPLWLLVVGVAPPSSSSWSRSRRSARWF
jgi:hypothetical protein